jgi:predicted nucleic acid-binding protein
MPNYLLDTNILSYWYNPSRPEHDKVLARLQAVRQTDPQGNVARLFVSAITIGEIEFGHRASPPRDASQQSQYMTFVREQCPEPYVITEHVGEYYGVFKGWLFDTRSPKGMRTKANRMVQQVDPVAAEVLGADENDLWIAAQAMTHNLVLVTHDLHLAKLICQFKETQQIEIDVEDWAQ